MNTAAWSPEERAAYDRICAEAWDVDESTAERTEAFLSLINDARQAHQFFAGDVLDEALRRGAASLLKSWHKARRRVPVSFEGEVLSKPRVIGTTVVSDDGSVIHAQTLFDLWTWEQLEAKAREYAQNIKAFRANLHIVVRLLELRERAPEATNPAQACERLGTTVEQWLATEDAA